jgi:phosphoglycerate dehydrogenase-like enzyme
MRVFNELGSTIGAQISDAVPDVEVIDLPIDDHDDRDAEVYFGGLGSGAARTDLLSRGVRWVALASTGIDKAPPALFEDDRVVTCARGATAIPIAEFAMAAMLAFEKSIPVVWITEPPRHWNLARLGGLDGRTLGLVGFGGIGTAIARRALGFGMRVLATRRTDRPSPIDGVEVTTLEQVLSVADHLVLAAPATQRTSRIIDTRALELVRPGLHLVNVSRGALVDHDALRVALDDGRVAMATLDTMEPEPLPEGHWLYEHPKVRVSAHVSWSSPAGIDRTVAQFIENLHRYVAGEPLHHVVDPAEGY